MWLSLEIDCDLRAMEHSFSFQLLHSGAMGYDEINGQQAHNIRCLVGPIAGVDCSGWLSMINRSTDEIEHLNRLLHSFFPTLSDKGNNPTRPVVKCLLAHTVELQRNKTAVRQTGPSGCLFHDRSRDISRTLNTPL